jgi:hypothetical protein
MKKRIIPIIATCAIGFAGFYLFLASRPLNIGRDVTQFARGWGEGKAMPDVVLIGGSKRMNEGSSEKAWKLLQAIAGPFTVQRVDLSPRFSQSQGVFVHAMVGNKPISFGIEGVESDGRTAIQFERMLGHACILREFREKGTYRGTAEKAMLQQVPLHLSSLRELGLRSVLVNGYSYPDWDEALTALNKEVSSHAHAG